MFEIADHTVWYYADSKIICNKNETFWTLNEFRDAHEENYKQFYVYYDEHSITQMKSFDHITTLPDLHVAVVEEYLLDCKERAQDENDTQKILDDFYEHATKWMHKEELEQFLHKIYRARNFK